MNMYASQCSSSHPAKRLNIYSDSNVQIENTDTDELFQNENTKELEMSSGSAECTMNTPKRQEGLLVPTVPTEYVPTIGMEFDTYDDAYCAYNMYAKFGGFSVRKHTSKKSRGERCWGLFVCSKEGFKKAKGCEKTSKMDTRCGCKARMIIKFCSSIGKWKVQMHDPEHNHILQSPSKMHMHRSSKGLDNSNKDLIGMCSSAGMRAYQIIDVMSYAAKGIENLPFGEEDVYYYLRKERESYFGKDAHFALRFFQERSFCNENFYYVIQTNDKNEVVNCFWIDAIAREDYGYFGDVVSFDTTYRKNRYLMPFAPFTGVNHHNQSIIFGCSLLGDEKKDSFVWLFSEWLKAMDNKPPLTIITDQDPAMKAAIREVFPNTIHRCCKWHIQQNLMKHASHLFQLYEDFNKKFYTWFNMSENRMEFEERWLQMTLSFPEMSANKWLNDLWENRASWSCHYSPITFMAGMSTTQRSESVNKMFKKWVNATTPLHLFVEKFEQAVNRCRYKEKRLDFNMHNGVKSILFHNPLAIHIRDVYTPAIFSKFQDQFNKLMNCHLILEYATDDTRHYRVIEYMQSGKEKTYDLIFVESKQEVSMCSCYLWHFSGVVCCHVLEVLKVEKIHELPKCYILKRWIKEAKLGSTNPFPKIRTAFEEGTSILHKKYFCSMKFNKCLDEAIRYEETYQFAINELERLNLQLQEKNEALDKSSGHCPNNTTESIDNLNIQLIDREPVRAKGCGKRIESSIHASKPIRICRTCQRRGHDSRTCPVIQKKFNSPEILISDKPVRRCNACHGVGHDKRNCKKVAENIPS